MKGGKYNNIDILYGLGPWLFKPARKRFGEYSGKISAGERNTFKVSNYDFLPTILSFLGMQDKIPSKPVLLGRDYSGLLKGQEIAWDDVIYYDYDNCRMIRTADWKYTERYPPGGCIDELYDLRNDPQEKKNILHEREYSSIRKQLQEKLHAFFDQYVEPEYDLWKGGGSKSRPLILRNKVVSQK